LALTTAVPSDLHGKIYTDRQLLSLRVPVGGIGTGNILVGGRGNIEYVEVFNRPDRRRRLEKTFFAIWCRRGEGKPTAKILERELFPPYGETTHKYVAGLPRLQHAEFDNQFPLHRWRFEDPAIPLNLSLEVFSPFIPLDVERSSYPLVAFYWELDNPTVESVTGSIVFSMENPIVGEAIANVHFRADAIQGVRFTANRAEAINYQGSLLMGTSAADTEIQTHWSPGQWRDETHLFWDDFSDDGSIESRLSDWQTTYKPTSYNETTRRMASVLAHFSLAPGQKTRIPFYLAWYFPKRAFRESEVFGIQEAAGRPFANAYSLRFEDERDVLAHYLQQEEALHRLSARFGGVLHRSTYPESVRESLATQAATLRTHLIQVTGQGDVHGFEGVADDGWCCPGTCTHVWNYAQTLASLFPALERRIREIEFFHDTFENGFQTHRSVLPLGDYWFDGPAAADGQMGTIVRVYREWKLSGDNEWLATLWPRIKRALEFAWYGPGTVQDARFKYQERQVAWDPNRSGVLSGRQHNTYDINFFGPSSMTTSIYLAALKAAAEMAVAMKDEAAAQAYLEVYRRGVCRTEDTLWNGSYFVQIIEGNSTGDRIPKYQYGDGCLSDQLLGQYLAFVSGLGYILDPLKVDTATKAIYDNNFIRSLRSFANVQRVYGLNDESGVVLCTWPKGNRPALPFVYSDEIWTGVEYQVAASLIYTGHVQEGLAIVEAVQARHDGYKRNPFEHNESGVHYARALAAWSLLLSLSGIEYDGTVNHLSFAPKLKSVPFSTFWSTGHAWGSLLIEDDRLALTVEYGTLILRQFELKGRIRRSYTPARQWNASDRLILVLN
jgi:uncharacterized protein (DUF608 family)